MPKALLAALLSLLALPAAAQEAKPVDPAPVQLTAQQDHKLMMEALKIEALREGANGMNPQGAERRQLRRVEGQPLPEPARPPGPEERREGHDRRGLVEQAAAGDRRGLRPGGLRPGPQGRAQGDLGGDRDDRGEGRRRGGRHQEARGPRRQLEVSADQGGHPAHADHAGRREGAGPGDDGVRLRRVRLPAGRASRQGSHAEGNAPQAKAIRGAGRREDSAAAARRGSSRSSPRAGATPSSSPTASRPTTARA